LTDTAAPPGPVVSGTDQPGARVVSSTTARRRRRLSLLLFAAPGLLVYGLFLVVPTLWALFMSFTDWNGRTNSYALVGLENYGRLSADPLFRTSIGTNLEFTIIVLVAQTLLSLGLAVLLARNTRANIFWRALYFVPTILASVSIAIAWILLYDPALGAINLILRGIGLDGLIQSWLGDRDIAIRSLAVIQFWQHTGQVMIVFVAGLQAIPAELHEAAEVEGASAWQRFRHVTLPLLAPSTTIVVAYTTIQSFRAFDLVISLTDGGPAGATEILATWIYHTAFRNYDYGYASAGAVLFLLLLGAITALQFRLLRVET
jgi:raffinose/stachyose/melibiose transport system permease protein